MKVTIKNLADFARKKDEEYPGQMCLTSSPQTWLAAHYVTSQLGFECSVDSEGRVRRQTSQEIMEIELPKKYIHWLVQRNFPKITYRQLATRLDELGAK